MESLRIQELRSKVEVSSSSAKNMEKVYVTEKNSGRVRVYMHSWYYAHS